MPSEPLTSVLDQAGVTYEVLPHTHTERAADEARELGVAATMVAKTLIVTSSEGNVRAVLPASERIDLRKLGELEGESKKNVHLASEDALRRDYPEFELGAVPPVGGAHGDRVVVDRRLAELDTIVLEAGNHDESIRVPTSELIRLAEARVADICAE